MTVHDADLPTVLVVDDDAGVRFTLKEVIAEADVNIMDACDGVAALELLRENKVDLVITDLLMPKMDGMELLRNVREQWPAIKVIMVTAHGSEAQAVQAMKLGAYDYFTKPFDIDEIFAIVRRATETVRLDQENQRLRAELMLARTMVFRSKAMSRVAMIVERAAKRDVTVLITGESGTGKELVARALVAGSTRSNRPFVTINCAALPPDLAEAEFFGHKKGAFTGAQTARQGVFREADTGTLFLDEIAELDLPLQGKLLRTLQEGEVRPVGEDRPEQVDVRIIAATHRDLRKRVQERQFREDLFYRLNVVHLPIPPLRERPEDIDPLIDHFLHKTSERFGMDTPKLSPTIRAKLHTRSYPGNIRELENTIERMVALCMGDYIAEEDFDALSNEPEEPMTLGLKDRLEAIERGLIVEELKRCGGNRSEAARRLNIGRVTLLDKLKKYGID